MLRQPQCLDQLNIEGDYGQGSTVGERMRVDFLRKNDLLSQNVRQIRELVCARDTHEQEAAEPSICRHRIEFVRA
jgi:hypothetical protein